MSFVDLTEKTKRASTPQDIVTEANAVLEDAPSAGADVENVWEKLLERYLGPSPIVAIVLILSVTFLLAYTLAKLSGCRCSMTTKLCGCKIGKGDLEEGNAADKEKEKDVKTKEEEQVTPDLPENSRTEPEPESPVREPVYQVPFGPQLLPHSLSLSTRRMSRERERRTRGWVRRSTSQLE